LNTQNDEAAGDAAGAEGGPTLEGRLERLALFEEGITHVREAENILAQAELKVEELVRKAGGGSETRPLDSETE